jgi:hypothetical protein
MNAGGADPKVVNRKRRLRPAHVGSKSGTLLTSSRVAFRGS